MRWNNHGDVTFATLCYALCGDISDFTLDSVYDWQKVKGCFTSYFSYLLRYLAFSLLLFLSVLNLNAQYKTEEKIIVSTYAGSGIKGFQDGPKEKAQLESPNGISLDKFGNLFIADSYNNAIRKVTSLGELYTLAGNGSEGYKDGFGKNALFHFPSDAYADKNGNIYVADYWNHCIRKITSYGLVTTIAGVPGKKGYKNGKAKEALFNNPIGVIVDYTDNLYVLDTKNHCIRKISNDGMVTTFAGSPTPGFVDGIGTDAKFSNPTGLCADRYGNFYVIDTDNRAVRKIYPDQRVETVLDHHFTYFKDSTQGRKLQFFHSSEGGGICSGPKDIFFIADGASHTIYKVDLEKRVISVIAGTGKMGYKNGEGHLSMFANPVEITMDASNNLYVSDFGNHVVRKIEFQKIKIEDPQKPKEIIHYLYGNIVNAATQEPIPHVNIVVQKYEGIDLVKKNYFFTQNSYKIPIQSGTHQIFVKQPGFMPFQAEIEIKPNQDFHYNIELIPIKVGAKAVLRNIYFAPNSASLTIDALEGLEKLVEFMKINPKVEILISGHTDIGSTQEFNIKLSEARAKAVKDYLVQMGIEPSRISHKGYGNAKPIADNHTPEGRALNRRIEIEIIKM